MHRREALKKMGIGVAATVYSSSVISLLESCGSNAAKGLGWKPSFFSGKQAIAIEKALDVILPTTEHSPGALELGIPEFLDKYVKSVAGKEEQVRIKEISEKFISQFESSSGKKVEEAGKEDFETIIAKNFTGEANRDEAFEFLDQVRYRGVWAWKRSKRIGEFYMEYDPVPNQLIGCRPLEEDGKLSSL